MKSAFTPSTLTFLVVANMIGAGVFTTSGFSIADLGSPTLVLAAWIVGGFIALAGAVSYGRLVRAMPESGGEYLFLSRAMHPLIGFIAGWVSMIAGFSGAIAFAATAFESYVAPAGVRPDWLPEDVIAALVIVAGGFQHGVRVRLGARVQDAAVVLKLFLLAGFLVIAVLTLPSGNWAGASLGSGPTGAWAVVAAFAGSLVWISLSYSGFNAAVYVAEESEDARRVVPAALLRGASIVVVFYVLLNAVFVFGPPPERIAGQPDVAAIAAQWLAGDAVAALVRAIISVALLTSVSSMMMAAPRVYAKMAQDGLLPGRLRFGDEAPRGAVVAQVAIALVLVYLATLRDLLSYLGLTLSLTAALSATCLFLPSVRAHPLMNRANILPLFYVGATLLAGGILAVGEPRQLLGTVLTFALGAAAYVVARSGSRFDHRWRS